MRPKGNVVPCATGLFALLALPQLLNRSGEPRFKNRGIKSLPVISKSVRNYLCKQDSRMITAWTGEMNTTDPWFFERNFFEIVLSPLQSVCWSKARFGDNWRGWGYEGGSTVCVDELFDQPCLVYSFDSQTGISFEEAMIDLGCKVYTYAQTETDSIKMKQMNKSNQFTNNSPQNIKSLNASDFKLELLRNNHMNATLAYLKVEVHKGSEKIILGWLDSGLLKKVKQLCLEMHGVLTNILEYDGMLRKLHAAGFRIIHLECNMLAAHQVHTKHCPTFELVLMRRKSYCE